MKMNVLYRYLLIAACCLMSLLSCTKEEAAETVTVCYEVSFYDYEIKSTALGDGSDINHIWYAVYNTDGSLFKECEAPVLLEDGKAQCPVTLVLDQPYKVVFLGMHYDSNGTPAYVINPAAGTVSQRQEPLVSSNKTDLFYAYDDIVKYIGTVKDGVTLSRIVSQINFACTETDWVNHTAAKPVSSSLVLKSAPYAFSLTDGKILPDTKDIAYSKANLPSGTDAMLGANYRLLTAYSFAAAAPELTTVSAELKLWKEGSTNHDYLLQVSNVDLQINKHTNVTGDILSMAENK